MGWRARRWGIGAAGWWWMRRLLWIWLKTAIQSVCHAFRTHVQMSGSNVSDILFISDMTCQNFLALRTLTQSLDLHDTFPIYSWFNSLVIDDIESNWTKCRWIGANQMPYSILFINCKFNDCCFQYNTIFYMVRLLHRHRCGEIESKW